MSSASKLRGGASFNFGWIVKDTIAGVGMPCVFWGDTETQQQEIRKLQNKGIQALLSMTEDGFPEEVTEPLGIEYLHVAVADHTAPTQEQIDECVEFIELNRMKNKPVAVHCWAGRGRTGTILASWLIYNDMHWRDAIEVVRQLRSGSIECKEQVQALSIYWCRLCREDLRRMSLPGVQNR